MYARCINCHSSLGQNEVLEPFPVGRRLAFDPDQGRLWALCRACRQWNLAPLSERWEGVEAAERLFEGAAVGARTDNIALARTSEGTELVRIGGADRPEVAAWRYGDRLLGRWRWQRRALVGAGAVGLLAGALPIAGGAVWAGLGAWSGLLWLRDRQPVMRTAEDQLIRRRDARRALLVHGRHTEGWEMVVPRRGADDLILTEDEALVALRRLLPKANYKGGSPDEVRSATEKVLGAGDPRAAIGQAAADLEEAVAAERREFFWRDPPPRIVRGRPVLRLALEMAVNEETERRALEGELGLLEREWREAEELAAIADDLLFPSALRDRLEQLRRPAEDAG